MYCNHLPLNDLFSTWPHPSLWSLISIQPHVQLSLLWWTYPIAFCWSPRWASPSLALRYPLCTWRTAWSAAQVSFCALHSSCCSCKCSQSTWEGGRGNIWCVPRQFPRIYSPWLAHKRLWASCLWTWLSQRRIGCSCLKSREKSW